MQMDPENIVKGFSVSVFGSIYLMQAAYPHMTHGGRIINVGSIAPKLGLDPIYSASKAAIHNLSFTLAREVSQMLEILLKAQQINGLF